MLVKYVGTKTAYYNDRSYYPDEVYEIPDRIPLRDRKGKVLMDENGKEQTIPLVLSPHSKMKLATEEEAEEYYRKHPRAIRRAENDEIRVRENVKRNRKTRASNPLKADGVVGG